MTLSDTQYNILFGVAIGMVIQMLVVTLSFVFGFPILSNTAIGVAVMGTLYGLETIRQVIYPSGKSKQKR